MTPRTTEPARNFSRIGEAAPCTDAVTRRAQLKLLYSNSREICNQRYEPSEEWEFGHMALLPESPVDSPVSDSEPSRSDDQELTAAAELVIMLESTSAPLSPTGTVFI